MVKTSMCGCYYCLEIYPESEINKWVDSGITPVCPYCHIDSVLVGQTDMDFLKKLHNENFRETECDFDK